MAVAFFPCHMRQLMNLLASLELKRASGLRLSALAVRLRAMVPFLCLVQRRLRNAQAFVGRDVVQGSIRSKDYSVNRAAVWTGDLDCRPRLGAARQSLAGAFQSESHVVAANATANV